MINYVEYKNIDRIYFIGDVHGHIYDVLKSVLMKYNVRDSLFIFLGDCGIGFIKNELKMLSEINRILKKHNSFAILIRGNHDNPSAFNDKKESKRYIKSNIRTVSDYTILNVSKEGICVNILCLGGAVSVDRLNRQLGVSYWKDEDIEIDQRKLLDINNLYKIDVVASHEAPDFAFPSQKDYKSAYSIADMTLDQDIATSRGKLSYIFRDMCGNNNAPKYWYYAHHHASHWHDYDGCRFYLSDIDEVKDLWYYNEFRNN